MGFVWRQPGSDTPVSWDWQKGEFAGESLKDNDSKDHTAKVLADEALRLYNEKRSKQALTLAEIAIENDAENPEYLNLKGIILQDLRRFSDSAASFDMALEMNPQYEEAIKNKILMLYDWANSLNDKKKALDIISTALDLIGSTDLNPEKFWYLKGSVLDCLGEKTESRICYLKAEGMDDEIRELESQFEMLSSSSDTLINVTGTQFYFGPDVFKKGQIIDLKRERDNEHDADAIRVEIDGETVGYVANSDYTVIEGVKSASDIKKMDVKKAEVLFIYMEEYVIAKLL